jgi:AraC family transcriptional regulator, regulatory protein of adaptative response / DNA-3-methyladenine glycosylase II
VYVAELDFDQCYQATESRDARFDGWFIVGVRTTGVYCRPSCPSPVCPKPQNVVFYKTAAAAQLAGLRACKRCRPDAVPGSPEWDTRADLVGRAMRLIADGLVDRDGVAGLARALAVSERHLNRLLVEAVGAPPLALARSQRAQTAGLLIETTTLPFTEVAFSSGFASVRQFNDTIRQVFGAPPSELRRSRRDGRAACEPGRLALRLAVRRPYDRLGVVRWLAARAIAGVEEAANGSYRRALRLPSGLGLVDLEPRDDHVRAAFRLHGLADLAAAVQRCRRLLDLDADPFAYAAVLGEDDGLGPLVAANPGLRAPGTADVAESAARAVLGQQVSLRAARTLAARIAARYGTPLDSPEGSVTHAFPSSEVLATARLDGIGLPATRRRTLCALAQKLATGELVLDGGVDRADALRQLLEIPGIGHWTAAYVSLRALGDPDAFPVGDLGLRRGAAKIGLPSRDAALAARSESWRPWRAYAAHYLWSVDA